jgi:5-methylcytosine-specific restriction endonuclease McrA
MATSSAAKKEWYAQNRERERAKRRAYYAANRERMRAQQNARRREDPEANAARCRGWYAANREAKAAAQRAWRDANPEKAKATRAANKARRRGTPFTPEARDFLVCLLRDPCVYCGAEATTVDHIEPLVRGGDGSLDNLASACRSCNASKKQSPLLLFLRRRPC